MESSFSKMDILCLALCSAVLTSFTLILEAIQPFKPTVGGSTDMTL